MMSSLSRSGLNVRSSDAEGPVQENLVCREVAECRECRQQVARRRGARPRGKWMDETAASRKRQRSPLGVPRRSLTVCLTARMTPSVLRSGLSARSLVVDAPTQEKLVNHEAAERQKCRWLVARMREARIRAKWRDETVSENQKRKRSCSRVDANPRPGMSVSRQRRDPRRPWMVCLIARCSGRIHVQIPAASPEEGSA